MTTITDFPDCTDNDCCHTDTDDDRCHIDLPCMLNPNCFKLRIGYDPTVPSYDISLCSLIVVFTCEDACYPISISGNTVGSIVLRIPLTFAHECFVYRINVPAPAGVGTGVAGQPIITAFMGATPNVPLDYYITDGYLCINVTGNFIDVAKNADGSCNAYITFDTVSIPLVKISTTCVCDCEPLCPHVNWVIGDPPFIPTTSTTTSTTTFTTTEEPFTTTEATTTSTTTTTSTSTTTFLP